MSETSTDTPATTDAQAAYEMFGAARWPNDPGMITAWSHPAVNASRPAWEAIGSVFAERDRYKAALERFADEDTWILGEGLGGGHQEEHHVRAQFAAHTLGRPIDCCTECMVSLGIPFPGDEPDSAREAVDAQTLIDSPGSDLDDGLCPDCGMRHKYADDEL